MEEPEQYFNGSEYRERTLDNLEEDLFRYRNCFLDLKDKASEDMLKKFAEEGAALATVRRNYAHDLIEMDKMKLEIAGLKGDGAVWQCKLCSGPPYADGVEMTVAEIIEEEDKPVTPMLRLVSGGKSPPTSGENWLKDLEKNCVFSCQELGKEVEVELYCLIFKHEFTAIIEDALGLSPRRAVNMKGFSKKYVKIEILEEGGERPEVVENGNSIREVRSLDDTSEV